MENGPDDAIEIDDSAHWFAACKTLNRRNISLLPDDSVSLIMLLGSNQQQAHAEAHNRAGEQLLDVRVVAIESEDECTSSDMLMTPVAPMYSLLSNSLGLAPEAKFIGFCYNKPVSLRRMRSFKGPALSGAVDGLVGDPASNSNVIVGEPSSVFLQHGGFVLFDADMCYVKAMVFDSHFDASTAEQANNAMGEALPEDSEGSDGHLTPQRSA